MERALGYAAPLPPPPPDGGRAADGWVSAALLLSDVACALTAMLLGGAGHGWSSVLTVSLVAVFTSPLAGVAWALRRRASGKGIVVLLVAAAFVANWILVASTKAEGPEYFGRTVSSAPVVLIVWAALWAVWQVVAVAAFLCRRG